VTPGEASGVDHRAAGGRRRREAAGAVGDPCARPAGEGDGPAPEPPPAAAPLDWPERRRALEDLDTTLLVEAGAGSGKTTLLLGRIVALLRSGRARLSEIAAITFTEKAATDLKLRLRGELERAGLAEALRELESARIGTIHAFVAGLLRERPVEAGVDPGFTVADPLAARLLQDAAWEAWLPEALAEPGAAEPVREALERGVGLERLRALAYALVEERDHLAGLPPPAPHPEPPEALNADARAIIARLEARARDGARDPDDRAVGAIATLGAWAQQTAALPAPEQVRALLASAPLPPRADRLGNQARWRDRTALAACRTELAALRARVEAARAVRRHNLVAALAGWAAGFARAYEARKARAGCLDFMDLLLRARDLVRDRPDVRRDFQQAIRYLLVDEFQDTDPLQLETVLLLADGAPPGSLFVVGDPKQSIYRFRRADIETYEAARARLERAGAVLTIRANFRSAAEILDAVNAVFEGVMVPPPEGCYQPAYVPLEPSPRTRSGRAPVVLALANDAPPPTSIAEAADQEARMLAAYLRREADAGRLRHGEVALLFRAMTAVAVYEDALRAAGVPFRTVGGRHYYDRSEVGWTIAALAAIEDPHDAVALVGALRSPFFGVSDEALARFHAAGGEFCYLRPLPPAADPGLRDAWRLLGALHRERNALAPPAVVERLLTETQVVAAYALEPHGEARVANLLKVLDTARALEATGALTFRGLVRWLRDRGAARYEEEESALDADDAVRLMTIHKAKGLEFPVVVVPDLGREAAWRAPIVLADRQSGRLALNLGRAGESALTTLDWVETEAREQARVDAEALRLLYVALTRAERLLVLPVPPRPEGNGFYRHLAALLGAPTETLSLQTAAGAGPAGDAAPPAAAPESLEAWWRARQRLVARGVGAPATGEAAAGVVAPVVAGALPACGRAGPAVDPGGAAPPAPGRRRLPGRAGRRATAGLARDALLATPLAGAAEAAPVVAALGARRGARADVVTAATGAVAAALASPILERARRAAWVRRDVPVAVDRDGTVVQERLGFVFPEGDGVVAVRLMGAPDADAAPGLSAAELGRALGRPVRAVLALAIDPGVPPAAG